MEWLRNMNLKKSFFVLSVFCLVIAGLLLFLVYDICAGVHRLYPSGSGFVYGSGRVVPLRQLSLQQQRILMVVDVAQLLSWILFPVGGLGAAGLLFYRLKLKTPIALLQEGTERILRKDLDFEVPQTSEDELGKLCRAFEAMRAELVRTNRELWEQAEERKRLNAAFSHDLRNPVTILKGTVKLLKQGQQDEHALDRLERYTLRIENYIEAMSGIQRLEQLQPKPKEYAYSELRAEIEDTAKILAPSLTCEFCTPVKGSVRIDHGIFLNVLENLVGNAARFAKKRLNIELKEGESVLTLSVRDDGEGFPLKLIQEGPKPFGRWKEEASHFGMGLYSCQVLIKKHGGTLKLENLPSGGASAAASFGYRKNFI